MKPANMRNISPGRKRRGVWYGLPLLLSACGSEPPLCETSAERDVVVLDAGTTAPSLPAVERLRGFDLSVNFIVGQLAMSNPDTGQTCFRRCGPEEIEQRLSFRIRLTADRTLRASDDDGEQQRVLSTKELAEYEALLTNPALAGVDASSEDPLFPVTCPAVPDVRWQSQLLLVDEKRFRRSIPQAYGCFQSGLASKSDATVAVSQLVHWAIDKGVALAGCTDEDAVKLASEQDEEAPLTEVRALCRVLPP